MLPRPGAILSSALNAELSLSLRRAPGRDRIHAELLQQLVETRDRHPDFAIEAAIRRSGRARRCRSQATRSARCAALFTSILPPASWISRNRCRPGFGRKSFMPRRVRSISASVGCAGHRMNVGRGKRSARSARSITGRSLSDPEAQPAREFRHACRADAFRARLRLNDRMPGYPARSRCVRARAGGRARSSASGSRSPTCFGGRPCSEIVSAGPDSRSGASADRSAPRSARRPARTDRGGCMLCNSTPASAQRTSIRNGKPRSDCAPQL